MLTQYEVQADGSVIIGIPKISNGLSDSVEVVATADAGWWQKATIWGFGERTFFCTKNTHKNAFDFGNFRGPGEEVYRVMI